MSNSCSVCKYKDKESIEYPCSECSHNYIDQFKSMTNFDKIKAMSVSELASFICSIYDEDEGAAKFIEGVVIPNFDEDRIQDWLDKEVET